MSYLDSLSDRNGVFAAGEVARDGLMPSLIASIPHVKALIIGCADMRVDPAQILGLAPGEALVLRNIGGRITPALVQQIGLLGRIGEIVHARPGGEGEFHLIVLHHTDCGINALLADPVRLAAFFQVPEPALADKAVTDPRAAVALDVAMLRTIPTLPAAWLISGLVYDVSTGLIEVIVPAASLGS